MTGKATVTLTFVPIPCAVVAKSKSVKADHLNGGTRLGAIVPLGIVAEIVMRVATEGRNVRSDG